MNTLATNRPRHWAVVVCVVLLVTSAVSHVLVRWLGIRTGTVHHRIVGDQAGQPRMWAAGSSLMGDGLDWPRICGTLGLGMETWFVAGSSPSEWEPFQIHATNTPISILCISAYDINEEYLCDFYAQIVPFTVAVRDLQMGHSNWESAKRVISQYPLKYLRVLFPTAGRSLGVLGGLKEQLGNLLHSPQAGESEKGPTVPTMDDSVIDPSKQERLSNISEGTLLRSLAKLRNSCQGRHTFHGPKHLAFLRMLHQARVQGQTVVVVLPVSPSYREEFLTPEITRQFEQSLTAAQQAVPEARWIRLDQRSQLDSNEYFCDVVHLNVFGQQIATDALLGQMHDIVPKP